MINEKMMNMIATQMNRRVGPITNSFLHGNASNARSGRTHKQ
jgi:hypothetical protein